MKLTVVGLPIGNVEDLSARALKVLSETNFIVCEDSRMFNNLWSKLTSLGKVERLGARIKFVNDFNEHRVLPSLLEEMNLLEEAVLVSDAGMPLISDPGYKLVHEGLALGWEVSVVPGPTAESAALAVSGLPTDKYVFLGFLPKKPGKRNEMLKNIKSMSGTMSFSVVIYESTVRLEKILNDLVSVFGGDSRVCLAIDLTKVSEKIFRGSIIEVLEVVKSTKLKGEATIILSLA
ncbi:TPA: 16S rRNA (cytidine(1402)-2'-O)-methyltransferase [Candidatus Collierbacteria bacterium]|uniref:Ribosomal RNA small subunit methyltransferase I n=1 Tax=Candidatus Collierbacteria bacterium GW2011_GWB2_44_22 TaxID=1618387 RepID=A0A0G1HY16_9BACT|nr:MAG: Ribosomal RNA small subunit methyltransferase I [Candidatus Collierbacteria bacterium GW2011_GWA2_44_13]KKT51015.1 MAG: Ribosomal RNA small subunit methyltransferase I [Candidatus Collierbacteria bacterium GW2011_GWB1_44_197]KKT51503.1 MAG: Ribosomal RNA small subunit methyltransferase I [Candidatus Collierbacteria bacterium GW2011_GWB2_44_22]KKT62240.1 MAG: Ribosomal RNA small subunit methyltransferase I [Candidatus Collierbacteria bacterium GW2011_GWD1_44_27]KKT66781.1 MAG: Ribosomal 